MFESTDTNEKPPYIYIYIYVHMYMYIYICMAGSHVFFTLIFPLSFLARCMCSFVAGLCSEISQCHVRDEVCGMCGMKTVFCAGFSLWFVWVLACVMWDLVCPLCGC